MEELRSVSGLVEDLNVAYLDATSESHSGCCAVNGDTSFGRASQVVACLSSVSDDATPRHSHRDCPTIAASSAALGWNLKVKSATMKPKELNPIHALMRCDVMAERQLGESVRV